MKKVIVVFLMLITTVYAFSQTWTIREIDDNFGEFDSVYTIITKQQYERILNSTPMKILDDGSKEYVLSENHTRVIMPDGTVQDYISSYDEFHDTLDKILNAADWMPARTHMGDGTFVNTVNIKYSDFGIDPEEVVGREFSDSGFIATMHIKGGFLIHRSFDIIGKKMEQASYMTPSVYKKNGFDDGSYMIAWWLNESGQELENDSNESVQLDFDR